MSGLKGNKKKGQLSTSPSRRSEWGRARAAWGLEVEVPELIEGVELITFTKFRPRLFGAIAALVVLGVVLVVLLPGRSAKEPIKIGVVPGFLEPLEQFQDAIKGMQLFAEEINKRGGVNGRKIELIVAKYEIADQEHALQALENIEQAHKPLVYISVSDSASEFTAAFAEEHEVVQLAIFSAVDATEGREWAFRYDAPLQSYFDVAVLLTDRLGVESLSFLYNRDGVFGPLFPTITPEMLDRPALKIGSQSFGDEDTDFREQIMAIKDNDAIFFYTPHPRQARDIVRQLRELDYTGSILTAGILVDPNSPDIPEYIGVYVGAPIINNLDFIFAQEVRRRFDATYETSVFSFFNDQAAEGYDTVRLIAELLELGEEPAIRDPAGTHGEQARENLRNILDRGFSYGGIFGNVSLRPGEHSIEIPLYPARYGDGKLEYLE